MYLLFNLMYIYIYNIHVILYYIFIVFGVLLLLQYFGFAKSALQTIIIIIDVNL